MNGVVMAKNNMYGEKKVSVLNVPEVKKEPLELGFEQRLLEEVKAAVFLAKQFPRDEMRAEDKIIELCKRERFADTALYSFPRGNETVEGVTIRFAEALARAWGNIQYSVIELDTENGVSKMLAYAWDVENNTKSTRQFDVSMTRYTKAGVKNLSSFQECYEMKASYGARFLRGCILNLIPNDIIEIAVQEVKKTLSSNIKNDLESKKVEALEFMKDKLNLSKEELENYLNCKFENWQEKEILNLKFAFNGIREGQMTVQQMLGVKVKVETINDEQIQELWELDKDKNKLFFYMQKLYRKTFIGSLTNREYAELKNLLVEG